MARLGNKKFSEQEKLLASIDQIGQTLNMMNQMVEELRIRVELIEQEQTKPAQSTIKTAKKKTIKPKKETVIH